MFPPLPSLENLIQSVRPADVLDVSVVAVLIYFALLWLTHRATRSALVVVGLAAMLFLAAHRLGMVLTLSLFEAGLTALLLGLVILFQEDLRRAFERMTSWGRGRVTGDDRNARVIDTLIESAEHLADRGMGALIVLLRRRADRCPADRRGAGPCPHLVMVPPV